MKINYRICADGRGYFHLVILITFAIFSACSSSLNDRLSSQNLISTNSIKANLEFLASDELEGREAATRGEKLAALFISSELKKYGVKPLYDDFLQEYKLNSVSADSKSNVEISSNGTKIKLIYPDDFIVDRRSSVTTRGTYKLVFAGFGITAPEFNYDDYKNLNVNGKIVVIADDEPYSKDTTYFDGEKKSKYSKESFKVPLAKSLGAAGLITIPSDYYFKNWDRIKRISRTESVSLSSAEREKMLNLIFNEESFSVLFKDEKHSFDEIKNLIQENKSLTSFELNKEIEIDVSINDGIKSSYNVVGVIEGNDSQKKHDYISIGAHYDHVGVIEGKVYNGADDNASGTAAMLEVAKAFAETRQNERSVLIVFHGAEEKGLLGSRYFTDNFKNIENIIAHINMDMVGREHIDTIYSVGAGKISPEFKNLVEEVNSETVNFVFNYKFDDPSDRQRIYYRSDHYNYARHGIPIVFFYDYMLEDYHKHTDETDKINFEKIRKVAILVYNIALRTANIDRSFKINTEEIKPLSN